MRLNRPSDSSPTDRSLSPVPGPAPARPVAPDWKSPTEGNGSTTPRADLHIALVAPNPKTAHFLRDRIRIVRPPLWHGGKVYLHIIPEDQRSEDDIDILLAQTLADLGLADAADMHIGPPDGVTLGYPSGDAT